MSPAVRSSRSAALALLFGVSALLLSLLAGVLVGSEPTSLLRALRDPESLDRVLIVDARLPRVLLGAIAGGGLAVVGVAFQALLRNPLAEPYVLGVSGGSALGATLAIAAGVTTTSLLGAATIPAAAMLGGIASTLLVYAISHRASAASSNAGTTILLSGVIVNALATALITFVKTLVTASKAQELLFWLMGFLDVPTTSSLLAVSVFVLGGFAVLMRDAGRMNLVSLGQEPAAHLGVDVTCMERRVFFACSAMVGAVVSVSGLIGFVGLIVPHLLRRLVGPDHRLLLPLSLLIGATSLVLCDLLSRLAFRSLGTEPPVGAITALIGGPMFLLILARKP